MRTIKGPALFLAQFAGDQAPFNSWKSITKWAADCGYIGVQIPSWDARLFDLEKAAVYGAVPSGVRLGLERKCSAGSEVELAAEHGQEPLRQKLRLGERAPHFLRRVRQIDLEREGCSLLGRGGVLEAHGSILSKRRSRRSTRSVQNAR